MLLTEQGEAACARRALLRVLRGIESERGDGHDEKCSRREQGHGRQAALAAARGVAERELSEVQGSRAQRQRRKGDIPVAPGSQRGDWKLAPPKIQQRVDSDARTTHG